MNYKIVQSEPLLDCFLDTLPDPTEEEVYYLCLFGRHKYDPTFPNTKDSGQLVRVIAKNKREIKEKLFRMETPLGSYTRDGVVATQACLATYISLNPRSLVRANKALLIEWAKRSAAGQFDFNPISVVTTEIHRSGGRRFFVDFDFDHKDPVEYQHRIEAILPDPTMYRIMKTRGGFHLIVNLLNITKLKANWHQAINLMGCDVRGSDMLTPIPGCVQGGFVPHFVAFGEILS